MSTSGASQSGGTRRPTGTEGDGTKPSKPDLFYGERSKLNGWLLQFDLYFRLGKDRIPEVNKVPLTATFIRGKALSWINSDLSGYMDGEATKETIK